MIISVLRLALPAMRCASASESRYNSMVESGFVGVPQDIRAERDWPPAVVACIHQTGVNLMRDLLRRGVRTAGIDSDPTVAGFRSIYGEPHLCPNPDTAPGEWVEFMKALSKRLGQRPVLMCASDLFVMAVGRHADELSEYFLFSPAAKLQAALCTKEEQYALAEQYDFPRPRTQYIQSAAQLKQFIEQARFPCLIKPRSEREWWVLPKGHPLHGKKIGIAATAEQLLDFYAKVEPFRREAVAQEMIQGPDSNKHCYLSVYATDSSRLGYCVVRELRCYPPQWGSASMAEPVIDPEIDQVCDRFLRKAGYAGLCEIEVKRDAADGKVKLIEVNPRFSGTGDASVYAGIEVGWLHYLDLIGKRPAPVEPPSGVHVHHIMLRGEVPGVVGYLYDGTLAWRDWLNSYRGRLAFYDFDWRDWRVSAETLWRCIKDGGGIFRRKVRLSVSP